jgi:formylglycine-generating enzyme required for sulfatase activity
MPEVYASLWENHGVRLWTLVNRSEQEVTGDVIKIEPASGERVFDLVAGARAKTRRLGNGAQVSVFAQLGPKGIGCVLAAAPSSLGKDFQRWLDTQKGHHGQPRPDSISPEKITQLRPVARSRRCRTAPSGMVAIPAISRAFRVEFRVRECGFYSSRHPLAEQGYPGLHQPIWFDRRKELGPYAIDLTPVTNAQYAQFLEKTRYRPRHSENFLRHWGRRVPPVGKENHPVVYVDLDDARAYAAWAGKRLPTEEEWQQAAQGDDGRKYPWGNEMLPERCNDGRAGGTTAVGSFPEGRSPYGLQDMCGNVWHWTESERSDGRTRFAILRGGSYYLRGGSDWYFDEGPKPAWFAAKMLLMWPGLDRCANIGFRCVADME